MKMSLCQRVALVCLLSIGITGSLLIAPRSEADPSDITYETHEYWTICTDGIGGAQHSFTDQETYASGWHEGDHWSGGNDYVPAHDVTATYRTVIHLTYVECLSA